MTPRSISRLHPDRWAFAVPLVWMSFVLAISFMEAPLKFRAPSLTRPVALEVGHIVFHALNAVEILLAILVLVALRGSAPSSRPWSAAVLSLFAIQCVLLFGVLDERTEAVIRGLEVNEAPWHVLYVGLEVVKVGLLLGLFFQHLSAYRGLVSRDHPARS